MPAAPVQARCLRSQAAPRDLPQPWFAAYNKCTKTARGQAEPRNLPKYDTTQQLAK